MITAGQLQIEGETRLQCVISNQPNQQACGAERPPSTRTPAPLPLSGSVRRDSVRVEIGGGAEGGGGGLPGSCV